MAWLILDNLTRHKNEVPHSLEVYFERLLMIWANACIRSHASLQNTRDLLLWHLRLSQELQILTWFHWRYANQLQMSEQIYEQLNCYVSYFQP